MSNEYGPYLFTGSLGQEFPLPPLSGWSTNFRSLRTSTMTVPGVSGGFDLYGAEAAPSQVGVVSVEYYIDDPDPMVMWASKEFLSYITAAGRGRLWLRPQAPGDPHVWCTARVQDAPRIERVDDNTDHYAKVTIVFEAAESRWYDLQSFDGVPLWDNGELWDDGALWGGGAGTPYSGASSPLVIEVTNPGTADVYPTIRLTCASGEEITNPLIERWTNGELVDSVQYIGAIEETESLSIVCRSLTAIKDVDYVYNYLEFSSSQWITLPPGVSEIQISSADVGDAGSVKVQFEGAYY